MWSLRGVIGFVSLGIAISIVAARADTPLQLSEDFNFFNNGGAQGLIAFSASLDNTEELYALDLESGQVVKLREQRGKNSYPAFAPDGQKLAFVSNREGRDDIYISAWDGRDAARISANIFGSGDCVWSPNGLSVYFSSKSGATKSNIFSYSIETGLTSQVTNYRLENSTPSVGLDANPLLYSANRRPPGWDICAVDAQRKRDYCILQSETVSYCRPKWSHSGEYFAFSMGSGDSVEIAVMDYSKGEVKTLTNLQWRNYDAEWSPDDTHIAFSHETQPGGRYELWIANVEDRSVVRVLSSRYSIRHPSWTVARSLNIVTDDNCPMDPLKTTPGACGCGAVDSDVDGDGMPDCNDACPNDPSKIAAGACGCGTRDDSPCPTENLPSPTPTPMTPPLPRLKIHSRSKEAVNVVVILPDYGQVTSVVRYKIRRRRKQSITHGRRFIFQAPKRSVFELSYAIWGDNGLSAFSGIVKRRV
jgi:TolB protein